MTKKMRELQNQIQQLLADGKNYLADGENKNLDKAEECFNKADDLQKEFDLLARASESEKAAIDASAGADPKVVGKADGFKAMSKAISGHNMDAEEKALITGANATQGENYLVPEDVRLAINELRKSYVSARELVTVDTTDALTGSYNYEAGTPAGLSDFTDGGTLDDSGEPSFDRKSWAIAWKGKIIPVSRILVGAEKAQLLAYLNRWFVKNSIISENADIFSTLKAGYNYGTPNAGVPKVVTGWEAFKRSINVDLDPSCLLSGVIATNQNGFACLDEEKDGNGRPILEVNPANPTQKMFQGLPIKVYPNAQLPDIDNYVLTSDTEVNASKTYYTLSDGVYTAVASPVKANLGSYYEKYATFPVFYGDTKAGSTMIEYDGLEFATSEHALFNKNQNVIRVLEGYDVISTDTGAYIYGSFSATPASN